MMPEHPRRGRKRGDAGYWFRTGRGWYATGKDGPVPLRAENGEHLKDPNDDEGAQKAYACWLLDGKLV